MSEQIDFSAWFSRTHLGRESMYKMLSEKGNPKLAIFTKVIQGLGLRLRVEKDVPGKRTMKTRVRVES